MNQTHKTRLKAVVLVGLVGCVAAEVADVSSTEQEVGTSQGSNLQGSNLQGSNLQGSNLQGTSYDGANWLYTSLTDAHYGASAVAATLDHATLWFWRYNASTRQWEQRFPNQICYWDLTRTTRLSCQAPARGAPKPIAGLSFVATFLDANHATFTARVQVGDGLTDSSCTATDASDAMFKSDIASTCTMDAYTINGCQNPKGCRRNCDIPLYDLYLVDPAINGGQPYPICNSGQAIAVPGTYDHDGNRSDGDGTQFTFSCAEGTIAKCTRWGFRPWGTATKTCNTSCTPASGVSNIQWPLVDLHQTCIRAAMADYCASGLSHTRPGTIVDVYDYNPATTNAWGFVPQTRGGLRSSSVSTAFVFETKFDKYGAFTIDHDRYDEVVSEPDNTGGFPELSTCLAAPCGVGDDCGFMRDSPGLDSASMLKIDSTTACAHSERTVGKWLHHGCDACTAAVGAALPYCTDPKGTQGWDGACVAKAQQVCTTQMTSHSECTAGASLVELASGCTATVCNEKASCCSSSWDASCVSLANARCYGGQEGGSISPVGFCGMTNSL
jgi:ADYC domain-containing protein/pentapeptide repeat protein